MMTLLPTNMDAALFKTAMCVRGSCVGHAGMFAILWQNISLVSVHPQN